MNLITNAELAAYAPDLDTSSFDATTISGMISRASSRINKLLDVDGLFTASVTAETGEAVINNKGELIISFRRRPVAVGDISAIRLKSIGVSQALDLVGADGQPTYFIPSPGNYMVMPSNYLSGVGLGYLSHRTTDLFYEIDYSGGFGTDVSSIPGDIKEAATLMLRDQLYNPGGIKSFSQGSYSESLSDSGKSQFISQARELLQDYIKVA